MFLHCTCRCALNKCSRSAVCMCAHVHNKDFRDVLYLLTRSLLMNHITSAPLPNSTCSLSNGEHSHEVKTVFGAIAHTTIHVCTCSCIARVYGQVFCTPRCLLILTQPSTVAYFWRSTYFMLLQMPWVFLLKAKGGVTNRLILMTSV